MGKHRVRTPLGEKRSKGVKVRLRPTESEQLRLAVEPVGGLSVGAYLHQTIQDAVRDMPMAQFRTIEPIVQARVEKQRVGVNLNQIAKTRISHRQSTPRRLDQDLASSTQSIQALEDASDELREASRAIMPPHITKRVRSNWRGDLAAGPQLLNGEAHPEEEWANIIDNH